MTGTRQYLRTADVILIHRNTYCRIASRKMHVLLVNIHYIVVFATILAYSIIFPSIEL